MLMLKIIIAVVSLNHYPFLYTFLLVFDQKLLDNQILKRSKASSFIFFHTMQVNHKDYGIPENVGFLRIKPMSNSDFKGIPPEATWFSANIYWGIKYEIFKNKNSKTLVKTTVNLSPKSWIRFEQKKLLIHEYGHYLIGCICALAFEKKINFQLNLKIQQDAISTCNKVLKDCLKFYCAQERLYDKQTYHYLNQQNQFLWEQKIKKQINDFSVFFLKNKPVETPTFTLKITSKNNNDKNGQNKIENQKEMDKKMTLNNKIYNKKDIQKSKSIISKRQSINYQINLYKGIQNKMVQNGTLNKRNQFKVRTFSKPK